MNSRRLSTRVLLDLIEQHRFGVEYQPIVSMNDESIIGYEALARFYGMSGEFLSPQLVFDLLHTSPLSLFQVEYKMKQLQLSHAPKNSGRLFVNLDPDAFQVGNSDEINPLVLLLAEHSNIVVEIIENSNINDAEMSEAMVSAFSGSNVELALDDIGAPHTMLSLPIMLTVDFLKFDRSWLEHIENPVHCSALRHLVTFARESKKLTILEGIENESHLSFAKQMGFDYVQGFLYQHLFIQSGSTNTITV